MFYCFSKSRYEDKFILKGGIPQVEVWNLDPEYRDHQDEIDEKVVGGKRKNVIVSNNPCHCQDIFFGDISKGDLMLIIVAIAEVNSMIVY